MYRMGQEEIDAVARVIQAKELFKTSAGPLCETRHLEEEMRARFGVKHAVTMTSGTGALTSALIGMGIGPGDEVIVPAYTYIATASAVLATGAIPVVAEVDDSLMMDAADVEKKITPHTKVIFPVHMMGYPANMDAIMAVAKKHNLLVMEDACQAVGGSYHGKYLGTIGDAGAMSFNFFKIISAGEAGAMLTNNRQIFETGLIYHDSSAIAYFGDQMQGFSTDTFVGTEYRTNEITSAILRVQFGRLDGILADLRKNKKMLMEMLKGYFQFVPSNDPEGECSNAITLQFDCPEAATEFFEKGAPMNIPAMMGKHVCWAWDSMLSKRGAAHPLMNPYLMEANKNAPEFCEDMWKRSIRTLSSCGHVNLNPDWTREDLEKLAEKLIRLQK